MSLGLARDSKVLDLQRRLYLKAKQERGYRFYSLIDKVYRKDVLALAWRRCRANGGVAGIDGVTFETIESGIGVEAFLAGLAEDLRTRRYRPKPLKRVYLTKPGGGQRPLSIPAIGDRVVQLACLLVISPIFEADFHRCSFGFRAKRSAHGAIEVVKRRLEKGYASVFDADLSGCFDSIPHEGLLREVSNRIRDGGILRLVRMWLRVATVEPDGSCQGSRSVGVAQGSPISPLLANIYLNLLDQHWYGALGPFQKFDALLIRYADDVVIVARKVDGDLIREVREVITSLGLSLNLEKTKMVDLRRGEALDFLGYSFKLNAWDPKKVELQPSRKACLSLRGKVRMVVNRRRVPRGLDGLIEDVNPVLRGWHQYFRLSTVRRGLGDLDYFVVGRFYRCYRKASQRRSKLFKPGAFRVLQERGLYCLRSAML